MNLSLSPQSPNSSDLPLFVFVPGLDGTGYLYQQQTLGLRRFFDVRFLSISNQDRGDWQSLSLDVVSLIKAEIEHKSFSSVYLCGESFGACLALKIALFSPNLIERLILVNPASSFARSVWVGWAIPWLSLVPASFYLGLMATFLPFLADTARMTPSSRSLLLKAMQSVPQDTVVWRLSLLQQFTFSNQKVSLLPMSVLLLAGTRDRLLPSVEEVGRLNRLFHRAKVQLLPNSGHACLLESKVNLAEILELK